MSRSDYLVLSPGCFLKHLEEPSVYNAGKDELYETNAEAFDFLQLCDGSRRSSELSVDEEFLDWCLNEGILTLTGKQTGRQFVSGSAPSPSLRYLELQITGRCNLRCRHCYLDSPSAVDMPVKTVISILEQFEEMQGLRLLISGGEPLLHPDFWDINEAISSFGVRTVLLTNGTLIDRQTARKLKVHETQVSLDGLGPSHDALRGRGAFVKAMNGIVELLNAGKEVSIATMIHAANLDDFPKMETLIKELGVKEWEVDMPCVPPDSPSFEPLRVSYQQGTACMQYGFGGGLHTSANGYACGANLCAVMPDGGVAKCGFFSEMPAGNIREGLRTCWERIRPVELRQLSCQCPYLEDCRGGCRYRALLEGDLYAPDPLQCQLREVKYDRAVQECRPDQKN